LADLQLSLPAFIPRLAIRLLDGAPFPPREPRTQEFDAAVLLADVSGFTGIVEQLSGRLGARGAEKLQDVLNACFVPLTELVDSAGGEVLSFPGDSALAVWTAGDESRDTLEQVICECVGCALDLRAKLDRLNVFEGLELRLRVAVGAGRSCGALVGGTEGQWDAVLLGAAIAQLRQALELAKPGEVVLSPSAMTIAGQYVAGTERERHLVVDRVERSRTSRHVAAQLTVPREMARALISPSVLGRIDAGHVAWLGEFRNATVMFLQLGEEASDHPIVLHHSVEAIQRTVRKFGGAVNQIVADDKGLTVVAAFGIAQGAHEDDPSRAARASLVVKDDLNALGVPSRIGIATGHVFTGGRGGASRQEFALLGGRVVLAARLAAVAQDILCDSATRSASRRHVRFESVPPVALKGRTDRVDVWRPTAIRMEVERGGASIIGRQAERTVLVQRLSLLEREHHGGVVLLEGEPGIGKTALVGEFLRLAQSHAVRTVTGAADSIEQRTPYLSWRPVLTGILGADAADDPLMQQHRVLELLGTENARWMPLLNAALTGSQAEGEFTLRMDADSRARATRELLIQLIDAAARTAPLVIVLEDAHWMDSASWDLVEQASARLSRVMFVITARPSPSNIEPLVRLIAASRTTLLRLDVLDADEIRELVCRRLDADVVPNDVVALINRRAEGHPLFAEHLTAALVSRGALAVNDGICRLVAPPEHDAVMPDTVHGIVGTRIDQLTPECQMTLKVAAVLGREFSVDDLAEVHPFDNRDRIERQVETIVATGLLRPSRDSGSFVFSHAVVQDVAYNLLAFAHRAELHRRTAQLLERGDEEHLDDRAPLLAHHWERANVGDKAMRYLELAGERALTKDSSYRDAIDFLSRLLALANADAEWGSAELVDVPKLGRLTRRSIMLARWERMLSQAFLREGRYEAASEHVERSLSLLGMRMPARNMRSRLELVAGLVARLISSPSGPRTESLSDLARVALLEVALAHENVSRQLYLGHVQGSPMIPGSLSLLRSVEAAELAGPSAELSKAYCAFSTAMAAVGAYKRSTHYTQIGESTAIAIGDRQALVRALTTGSLTEFDRGANWAAVATRLERAVRLGADFRLVLDCLICETLLAHVYLNEGNVDEALRRFVSIQARSVADHTVPWLWATAGIAETAWRQGRVPAAINAAQDVLERADKENSLDQNSRFRAHGILAVAALRTEGVRRAQRHLDPAIAADHKGAFITYTAQFGFIGVAETLLALSKTDGAESRQAARRLRTWLRHVRLIAVIRPIYRPWYFWLRARWHAQAGRRSMARQRLRRAVSLADRMQLPYESAVTRAELARLLDARDPTREPLLAQAIAICTTLGAEATLKDIQALK
jgi:tetratricopeptide (TPR) repeat protein